MTTTPWINADTLAEQLGVSTPTIYAMARAGDIPCRRIGRQYRFQQAEIDAWIEQQRPGSPGIQK